MTVTVGDDGELRAFVQTPLRAPFADALEREVAASRRALADSTNADDQRDIQPRIDALHDLQLQLEGSTGPAHVAGPPALLLILLQEVLSRAARSLDAAASGIAAHLPAEPDALTGCIDSIRTRTTTLGAASEALIAALSHASGPALREGRAGTESDDG